MQAKERLLTALRRRMPDRLPVTIHQWQPYHLRRFANGMSDIEAFRQVGLDASVSYFPSMYPESPQWRVTVQQYGSTSQGLRDYTITTPDGSLSYQEGYNEQTTWITKPLIKRDEDIFLIRDYYPQVSVDAAEVQRLASTVGDDGIIRMLLNGRQAGCWQDACCLVGTEEMIFAAFDKPDWVHELLQILLQKKLAFIQEQMGNLPVDLVETGGGASSSTVISPTMHREFCLPYDKALHDALHGQGYLVAYHTCGGMMKIMDLIAANGCDASETLAPPGVGGDITDLALVKDTLGRSVCLIGGLDQINILTDGTPATVAAEVERLFAALGPGGGYILSASDHFFEAPMENLRALAEAGRAMRY